MAHIYALHLNIQVYEPATVSLVIDYPKLYLPPTTVGELQVLTLPFHELNYVPTSI